MLASATLWHSTDIVLYSIQNHSSNLILKIIIFITNRNNNPSLDRTLCLQPSHI